MGYVKGPAVLPADRYCSKYHLKDGTGALLDSKKTLKFTGPLYGNSLMIDAFPQKGLLWWNNLHDITLLWYTETRCKLQIICDIFISVVYDELSTMLSTLQMQKNNVWCLL